MQQNTLSNLIDHGFSVLYYPVGGLPEAQSQEVLAAAQALGVTHGAIYQRLKNHPELAEIQQDAQDRVTDMVKARILKRIERDDWNAINLWATTKGGFIKQTAVSNPDGSPLQAAPAVHIHVSYVGDAPTVEDVV